MKKIIFSLFIILSIVFISVRRAQIQQRVSLFETVCFLVFSKAYPTQDQLSPWFYRCMDKAQNSHKIKSTAQLIQSIQSELDRLNLSHLYIMTPPQEVFKKTGQAKATGMSSKLDDGKLIVKKVYPSSSAAQLGIQVGDEITDLKGGAIYYPEQTFYTPGLYTFKRTQDGVEQTFTAQLKLAAFKEDLSIKIIAKSAHEAILTVPSFYNEIFSKELVLTLADELNKYQKVTIDLSDNLGGHVMSGLRLLSLFLCEETEVGEFVKPRSTLTESETLLDQDDFTNQYKRMFQLKTLKVRSFSGYGCYRGEVEVLVNEDTASISEIFAEALSRLKKVKIIGGPTAGEAVLALKYELHELGKGYSLLIPEAIYQHAP